MGKNYEMLLEGFKNPSSEYNPVTMWFWSGKITKEGITRELEEFRQQGVLEFFIHPCEGKEVEYLSDEFMMLIKHSVDEAKRLGMKFWIYDETDWPSGAVGGILARKYPQHRQKELWCEKLLCYALGRKYTFCKKADFLCAMRVCVKNGKTYSTDVTDLCEVVKMGEYTEVTYANPGVTDETIYLYFEGYVNTLLYACRASYNTDPTYGYLDMLSEEACAKFIELTHERYKEYVGDEFGKTVVGVFTDEPTTLYHFNSDVVRPWTTDFAEQFEKMHGYSLLPYLHTIFYEPQNRAEEKARTDYYNTMKEMYHRSFCGQIAKWCKENNLKFTGHFGGEEEIGAYISQGDMQTELTYMDVPGIDEIACDSKIHNTDFNIAGKLGAGAAKLAGKDRLLSETYTCCKWNYTLRDMKRVANRILTMGANMIQYMGAWYTVDHERWEGPAYSYQNTLYKHFNKFTDYIAPLQYLSSQTKPAGKVILFIPLMQAYNMANIAGEAKYVGDNWLQKLFEDSVNALLYKGVEYDLLSENFADRMKVESGAVWIDNYKYDCLVLPGMEYTNGETARLIKEAVDSGVKIIFVNNLPAYVAEKGEEAGLEFNFVPYMSKQGISVEKDGDVYFVKPDTLPVDMDLYSEILAGLAGTPSLNIEADKRVYIAKRANDRCEVYFISNDSEEAAQVTVDALPGIEFYNTDTKDKKECSISTSGRATMTIAPYEMVVALRDKESSVLPVREAAEKLTVSEQSAISSFKFTAEEGNQLVPRFEVYDKESECWYGCEWYHGQIDQHGINYKFSLGNNEQYKARTYFTVDKMPEKIYLHAIVRKIKKLFINGNEVKCDINIRTFSDYESKTDITPYVKQGENILELECVTAMHGKYRENVPFVMLTGDFGLDKEDKLVETPANIDQSGWEEQGYPYYSGEGIYEMDYSVTKPFKKAVIRLTTTDVAQLYVNDRFVTFKAWAPYEADITDFIKQGENKIKIRITSTRGNMFMKFRSPARNGLTDSVEITTYN